VRFSDGRPGNTFFGKPIHRTWGLISFANALVLVNKLAVALHPSFRKANMGYVVSASVKLSLCLGQNYRRRNLVDHFDLYLVCRIENSKVYLRVPSDPGERSVMLQTELDIS
jgi:hypothetical protein